MRLFKSYISDFPSQGGGKGTTIGRSKAAKIK
jgi:hypothetical protein